MGQSGAFIFRGNVPNICNFEKKNDFVKRFVDDLYVMITTIGQTTFRGRKYFTNARHKPFGNQTTRFSGPDVCIIWMGWHNDHSLSGLSLIDLCTICMQWAPSINDRTQGSLTLSRPLLAIKGMHFVEDGIYVNCI